MSCSNPAPEIENGYLAVPGPTKLQYMCNGGYSIVGSSYLICNKGQWTGNVACEFRFLHDVWFWLLVALGALLTFALMTALCVYCVRKCCRSPRVRPPIPDGRSPRYSDSSDMCCVDYYGCCSLFGCCGIWGCCSCCCGCFRCCREPGGGPGISNLPVSVLRVRGKPQKRKRPRPPIIIVQNETQQKGKRNSAKVPVIPIWMPHSNTIRSINTSTR